VSGFLPKKRRRRRHSRPVAVKAMRITKGITKRMTFHHPEQSRRSLGQRRLFRWGIKRALTRYLLVCGRAETLVSQRKGRERRCAARTRLHQFVELVVVLPDTRSLKLERFPKRRTPTGQRQSISSQARWRRKGHAPEEDQSDERRDVSDVREEVAPLKAESRGH
jgi:hypothetical protein